MWVGVYSIDIAEDNTVYATQTVQILAKPKLLLNMKKVFMWIFDGIDFSVIDIVELAEYEINIDEETNANSIVKVLKNTNAKEGDIVAIKKDNIVIYWGIVDNIQQENSIIEFIYNLKYITNLFDVKIPIEYTINKSDFEYIEENELWNDFYFNICPYQDPNKALNIKLNQNVVNAKAEIISKSQYNSQIFKVKNSTQYKCFYHYSSEYMLDVIDGYVSQVDISGLFIMQYAINLLSDNSFVVINPSSVTTSYGGTVWQLEDDLCQDNTNIVTGEYDGSATQRFFLYMLFDKIIPDVGLIGFIPAVYKYFFENTYKIKDFSNLLLVELGEIINPCQSSYTDNVSLKSYLDNGLVNMHTLMTNLSQTYGVQYNFSIENLKLKMVVNRIISNKSEDIILIDANAEDILDYTETFDIDVISRVIVYTQSGAYELYLKSDRTTTTDSTDPEIVEGKTKVSYIDEWDSAKDEALNIIRANEYNHNITFTTNKYIPFGTQVAVKTQSGSIYYTFISSIKITQNNFYEYQCGNIRVDFIGKLKRKRG